MAVVKRLFYERVVPIGLKLSSLWLALAEAVGGFIEEAEFRVVLAFNVLAGKVPISTEKRPWIRSMETPVLADVYDWTTDRLLFSVLVWPSLESGSRAALRHQRFRADEVIEAIHVGASEKAWSIYIETDFGLVWDHKRECWVDGDGYHYDGSRFGAGSRVPH